MLAQRDPTAPTTSNSPEGSPNASGNEDSLNAHAADLKLFDAYSTISDPTRVRIKVDVLEEGTMILNTETASTVGQVKTDIMDKLRIPQTEQILSVLRLTYLSQRLEEHRTLQECGIVDGTTVLLVSSLPLKDTLKLLEGDDAE